MVPGAGSRGVIAAMEGVETVDWLRDIHRHTVWTTSVCTGHPFSVLPGSCRGAITRWASSRAYLKSEFGAVYTPGRFVETGKVSTATGVSAGIDMALHLAAWLADECVAQAGAPRSPRSTRAPTRCSAS